MYRYRMNQIKNKFKNYEYKSKKSEKFLMHILD